MSKTIRIIAVILLALGVLTAATIFFSVTNVAVLNPKGDIAAQQRDLIMFTVMLISIVVIPVFIMLAVFGWKYREGNKKAKYAPNWDGNWLLETIWWGIPIIIISILGVVTWQTSHSLDPFKALDSTTKPLSVQVVALQWKWLFIYPQQRIASVNQLQIPKDTPINFTITADSPMNSFWIPSLGGQVYAMAGMSTQLHLIADEAGDYKGSSANISGKGFADMAFTARASSQADFDAWVDEVAQSKQGLDMATYNDIAQPGSVKAPTYYVLKDTDLYDKIVMKYMDGM
jgi:cytochrome o ubiquinol oxidase subunit 2